MLLSVIAGFVVFSIIIAGIYYAKVCIINRKYNDDVESYREIL